MSGRSGPRARVLIAREAARLMYEEQVGQYFTAKRIAAKRLFGTGGARRLCFRPDDLPSNGEIQAALLTLAEHTEGPARLERLARMRTVALAAMRLMVTFEPRLIGSVATGHVHRESDIDIQLFVDDRDAPESFLRARRLPYERDEVLIRRQARWCEYLHLRLDAEFPVELTVYPRSDLRVRARSSTDGKPIVRLKIADVEALLFGAS
jgi:hypothetical protein